MMCYFTNHIYTSSAQSIYYNDLEKLNLVWVNCERYLVVGTKSERTYWKESGHSRWKDIDSIVVYKSSCVWNSYAGNWESLVSFEKTTIMPCILLSIRLEGCISVPLYFMLCHWLLENGWKLEIGQYHPHHPQCDQRDFYTKLIYWS